MYNNQNNKKGERNWVQEYNKASILDKMVMDYEQRLITRMNDEDEARKRERAQQKARDAVNRRIAYEMASPEERARHDKLNGRKATLRLGAVAIFLGGAYCLLGWYGVFVGGIVAFVVYRNFG